MNEEKMYWRKMRDNAERYCPKCRLEIQEAQGKYDCTFCGGSFGQGQTLSKREAMDNLESLMRTSMRGGK